MSALKTTHASLQAWPRIKSVMEDLSAQDESCPPTTELSATWPSTVSALLPELLRLARRLTGQHAEAEDLLQDTLLIALQKSHLFDTTRPIKPWLVGIMHLHFKYLRRRSWREQEQFRIVSDSSPPTDEVISSREEAELVRRELAKLPPPYREVVELHFKENLTLTEIGRRLRRSPSTVSTQLNRGIDRLRTQRSIKAISRANRMRKIDGPDTTTRDSTYGHLRVANWTSAYPTKEAAHLRLLSSGAKPAARPRNAALFAADTTTSTSPA